RAGRRAARRDGPARTAARRPRMRSARFWLRRLAGLVLVLFLLSVMVFVIFNVIPGGDPAVRMAGRNPTPENIASIRRDWGFNKPLWVQYGDMMDRLFIK